MELTVSLQPGVLLTKGRHGLYTAGPVTNPFSLLSFNGCAGLQTQHTAKDWPIKTPKRFYFRLDPPCSPYTEGGVNSSPEPIGSFALTYARRLIHSSSLHQQASAFSCTDFTESRGSPFSPVSGFIRPAATPPKSSRPGFQRIQAYSCAAPLSTAQSSLARTGLLADRLWKLSLAHILIPQISKYFE